MPKEARHAQGESTAAAPGVRPTCSTPTTNTKGTDMDTTDRIDDFLAAVEDLRGEDETVRTTAHTSSVSAEGWPTAEGDAA